MEEKKIPTTDDVVKKVKELKGMVIRLQRYELASNMRDFEKKVYESFDLPSDYKVGDGPKIFCEIATKESADAKIWHLSTVLWPKESLKNLEFYQFKVLREFNMSEGIHE